MEGNYQSTSSRDSIWATVTGEPRCKQQSTQREKEHEHGDVQQGPETVKIQELNPKQGFNMLSAAVLLAGLMAGGGLLALPKAIVDCGWIGLILLPIFFIITAYSGTRLGVCWTLIEERYPEYRDSVRNPYATIAYKAVGIWGRRLVSMCILLTLFGAATVNLLVTSELVQELFESSLPQITYCNWIVVLAACLCPAMWLGSPKDFWIVGVGAFLATACAFVFVFTQIVKDGLSAAEPAKHEPHDFSSLFLSFGTILYQFSASASPTIQNDMINKKKFSTSVVVGFSMIFAISIPVTAGGYYVYGDAVAANIILTLSKTTLVHLANVLMAIHLILGFLIIVNPVCQEMEQVLNLPTHFNWKRILVRTSMLCVMVLIGETVPSFGNVMTLVGGSMGALLTLVLPPFFYMRLCDQNGVGWPKRHVPTFVRIFLWELILVGVFGGTAATYSALLAIFSRHSQTRACYMGPH